MALIIYGSPRSRTMRTLWAAEELGLDYELRLMEWDDPGLKAPAFLALNPAGNIPVIVDDGFALSESLAINLYLARKYGAAGESALNPEGAEVEAQAWRWTLWAQGQLEPWVQRDILWREALTPIQEAAAPLLDRALDLLDCELSGRPWLVADRFTVADLNVAAVLSPSRAHELNLAGRPAVQDWLTRCYGRPAARAVRARYAS